MSVNVGADIDGHYAMNSPTLPFTVASPRLHCPGASIHCAARPPSLSPRRADIATPPRRPCADLAPPVNVRQSACHYATVRANESQNQSRRGLGRGTNLASGVEKSLGKNQCGETQKYAVLQNCVFREKPIGVR